MAAKNTQKNTDKGLGFQSSLPDAKHKKNVSAPAKRPAKAPSKVSSSAKSSGASNSKDRSRPAKKGQGIPEEVSKRMVRRMTLFCGVPTALGLASFPTGYFLLQQGIELPNVAVLLVSLGFLGLGVLGLSYGVLSASWDEEVSGGALGWSNFKLNLSRTIGSWREARDRNKL
jgi:Photosynthesis affected mutant 68